MLTLEKKQDNGCLISLEGDFDIYHAAPFYDELIPCLKDFESFTFDFSSMGEMDTSCFQVIIQAKRECDKSNKKMTLVSLNPAILDILGLYGMEDFFDSPTTIDN